MFWFDRHRKHKQTVQMWSESHCLIQAAKRKTQTEIKTYERNVILKPVCRNSLLDKRTTRTTMKKLMFYDLK